MKTATELMAFFISRERRNYGAGFLIRLLDSSSMYTQQMVQLWENDKKIEPLHYQRCLGDAEQLLEKFKFGKGLGKNINSFIR